MIKQVFQKTIRSLVRFCSGTRIGTFVVKQLLSTAMEEVREVSHQGLTMKFVVPNPLCEWRVKTFGTKEPETLEWIESIPENSVLWDIGANVGLYTVYAAKKRTLRIWAFEPSVFNLELLARNLFLNDLQNSVCIVPVALCDRSGPSLMKLTTTEWGGALSTFGHDFGWDGKAIRQIFEFQTPGLIMDDVMRAFSIPRPDYIKLDVDGIEHLILKGGGDVLKNVTSILIEINDDFLEQAEICGQLLRAAGLILKEKRHSEMIGDSSTGFQNTYNQIWMRP